MARSGVTYRPAPDTTTVAFQSWSRFGVWRVEDARRFGYDPPRADVSGGQQLDEKATAAYESCRSAPENAPLRLEHYLGPETMRNYQFMRLDNPATLPEAAGLVRDWRACTEKAGFEPPPEPKAGAAVSWVPDNLERLSEEQRVKAALADVACKTKTDFVQRLADIDATRQQAVIDEHRTEFEAFRRLWAPLLTATNQTGAP